MTDPVPADQAKVGIVTQVSYGLGSFASGISATIMAGGLLQIYFNQVLGLPAVWVGAVIMASIVVDAVIDPLIGRFSDRLRSPLGRRHTLMYASAIPTALAVWVVWHAPQGLAPPALLAFMGVSLLAARIAGSFYDIPSTALAPELSSDPHERTSLFAWRWLFLILGLGAATVVVYQVYLRQDASTPLGMLNAERYAQAGTVAALAVCAAILISTAATHHRIRRLHVPPAQKSTLRETLADCREILADRQLLLIMGAGLLMGLAKGVEDGLSGYEGLHFWGLKPQIVGLLVGAAILAAVVALPLARPLGQALGKRRAMIWLFLVWIVSGAAPVALRFAGLFPANGSPALVPVLTVGFVISATCALTAVIILSSMISDAVDGVAARTGQRSEGLIFAVFGVLSKWAAGGGAFVAGAIISVVAFPARAIPGTVDPAIVNHMVLLHIPAGVALNLGAIFLLNRLDRAPKPAVGTEAPRPAEAA